MIDTSELRVLARVIMRARDYALITAAADEIDALRKERDEARRWARKFYREREWIADLNHRSYEYYLKYSHLAYQRLKVIKGLKNQLKRWVERARKAEGK